MKLAEFVEMETESLKSLEDYWMRMNRSEPELYPVEMPYDDWLETMEKWRLEH